MPEIENIRLGKKSSPHINWLPGKHDYLQWTNLTFPERICPIDSEYSEQLENTTNIIQQSLTKKLTNVLLLSYQAAKMPNCLTAMYYTNGNNELGI